MAHSKPHKHAVCEVDEHSKVQVMVGALQRLAGHDCHGDGYTKVDLAAGLVRVERAMWSFVDFCNQLHGTRNGVSGAGLRKALQATEDITSRNGGKCRLGLHEIDFLTSEGSRHRMVQREHPASAKMALLPLFDMMVEISRRCCDKDPALAGGSALDKLEWLLEALRHGTDAVASSSVPVLHRQRSEAMRQCNTSPQVQLASRLGKSKTERNLKEPGPLVRLGKHTMATAAR